MVTRTVELPGDKIEVHADIGPGRIVRAILTIEEPQATGANPSPPACDQDPFGKELDDLLAMTDPVAHFVDDSREAIYTPDAALPRKTQK